MPTTGFLEHAHAIRATVDDLINSADAVLVSLQIDQRSSVRGFIEGVLEFSNGSQLIFREFVDATQNEPRLMYAYHYQNAAQELVFRYDNAAHRPALSEPAHKHTPAGIEAASPPTLAAILDQIPELIDA
jgi:hypothetical protein